MCFNLQDTVVALQALSEYSLRTADVTTNIELELTVGDWIHKALITADDIDETTGVKLQKVIRGVNSFLACLQYMVFRPSVMMQ